MKKSFLLTSIIYLFGAAIIFPFVKWYADNPDTFQYITIARKVLSGNFSDSVNGYWSPLISWLLTIPLSIFKNEIIAFKVLQFIIGLFVIFQWTNFLDKTSLSSPLKIIISFAAIPLIIVYAFLNLTPDLLFAGLILSLLNLFCKENVFTKGWIAVQAGVTGGLLFLTKAFGFPFFIVVAIIICFKKITEAEKRENLIRIFTTFFVISLAWILILSHKYGEATISKAAGFNMSKDVAPLPGRGNELPILGKGLNAPQQNSFCAWESPGDYVSHETITPFSSPSEYFQIIKRNILSVYYFDFRHQPGSIFLLLFLTMLFVKRKELFKEKWILYPFIFIILLYGGYCLILFHTRYTWINLLLMLMLTSYFILEIFKTKKYVQLILISLIVLWTIKRPVKEILFTNDESCSAKKIFHSFTHPYESMWIYYSFDHRLKRTIDDVLAKNILHGNVASLKEEYPERDLYVSSLRLAMTTGSRYYGQLDNKLNPVEQLDELSKMKIDYLITYEDAPWGNEQPIYINPESKIRIYRVSK